MVFCGGIFALNRKMAGHDAMKPKYIVFCATAACVGLGFFMVDFHYKYFPEGHEVNLENFRSLPEVQAWTRSR